MAEKRMSCTAAIAARAALAAAMAVLVAVALMGTGVQRAEAAGGSPSLDVTRAATGKLTVKKGASYKLAAKASAGKVTYKSSKKKVVAVSKKGKLKAKKPGKATITVTAKSGSKKAVKKVKVAVVKKSKYKKVKKLAAKAGSTTLAVGEATSVTASFKPKKASNKNVTFASSNPSVLSVDAYGKATAKKAGSATVTVTSCDNKKAKATLAITVRGGSAVSSDVDAAPHSDDVANGTCGTCDWRISADGCLIVGPGTLEANSRNVPYHWSWRLYCEKIESLQFSKNASLSGSAADMFYECPALQDVDGLSGWDTSAVTDMGGMFYKCSSLQSVDGLSSWDVSNVASMGSMFQECSSLQNVDSLSNWKLSSSVNMPSMFCGCSSLQNASSLSSWNVSSETWMTGMFDGCTNLTSYPSWYTA